MMMARRMHRPRRRPPGCRDIAIGMYDQWASPWCARLVRHARRRHVARPTENYHPIYNVHEGEWAPMTCGAKAPPRWCSLHGPYRGQLCGMVLRDFETMAFGRLLALKLFADRHAGQLEGSVRLAACQAGPTPDVRLAPTSPQGGKPFGELQMTDIKIASPRRQALQVALHRPTYQLAASLPPSLRGHRPMRSSPRSASAASRGSNTTSRTICSKKRLISDGRALIGGRQRACNYSRARFMRWRNLHQANRKTCSRGSRRIPMTSRPAPAPSAACARPLRPHRLL